MHARQLLGSPGSQLWRTRPPCLVAASVAHLVCLQVRRTDCAAAASTNAGAVSCALRSPYVTAMEAAGFFKPQHLPAMVEQTMALVE